MKPADFIHKDISWADVMPMFRHLIEYDDDSLPLDFGTLSQPAIRLKGRVIPSRKSPSDPYDPVVVAFMKSLTPMVEMEPGILNGMPVFKNTMVPIKHMFDYLLNGKTLDDFLAAHPTVTHETATRVLETEATLFYEEISKAIDSAAMPSSLPK